jgi:purine-nucleoside phosphorylase
MRVLALSLVTNKAMLEPGPRGDDVNMNSMNQNELTKTIESGKANHAEVLEAGREAAWDFQVMIKSSISAAKY